MIFTDFICSQVLKKVDFGPFLTDFGPMFDF